MTCTRLSDLLQNRNYTFFRAVKTILLALPFWVFGYTFQSHKRGICQLCGRGWDQEGVSDWRWMVLWGCHTSGKGGKPTNISLCIWSHKTFNQQANHMATNPFSAARSELDVHCSGAVLITTEVGDWNKAYSPSNNHTHVTKASLSTDRQSRAKISMQDIISHPRARQTNTVIKSRRFCHILSS